MLDSAHTHTRIRDVYPGSGYSIPNPGSRGENGTGSRIRTRNILNSQRIFVTLTPKIVTKLSEIGSGVFIPDLSQTGFFPTPDHGSGSATLLQTRCMMTLTPFVKFLYLKKINFHLNFIFYSGSEDKFLTEFYFLIRLRRLILFLNFTFYSGSEDYKICN